MQGDKDHAIQVPFSDDEGEEKKGIAAELEEEDPPNASPEERRSRKQKRTERMHRLLEEGRQATEKVKQFEERDAQRERELAELRGMVTAQQQMQRAPSDAKDPYEAELDAIYKRQRDAYTAAQAELKAGTFTEERNRHYEAIAREVETSKARVLLRRELANEEPARRAQQGQQQWVQKYPEVYGNQQAYQYAEATFRRRQATLRPGEQVTPAMIDEAMQDAMATFRLGPKKAASETERQRMTGIPASGAGGGGSPGGGITLTPEMRRMAIAQYSDLSEADAIKAWANKTGKRMRAKQQL